MYPITVEHLFGEGEGRVRDDRETDQVPFKTFSPNVGLEPTTLRLRVSCSTD